MGSDAVGLERVSRTVGYKIKKGSLAATSPNLPQRIVLLGEANTANQSDLSVEPLEVVSAKQVGQIYGYGSPLHSMMRIIHPITSDGVGGIPVIVIPQAAAVGATAKIITITPSGVATGNGTHRLLIGGRSGLDGAVYDINIEQGDTVSDINGKIADAINGVLSSPVSASEDDYITTLTTKWKGLTAQETVVEIDRGDSTLGISYVIAEDQAGSGTPSVVAALNKIGNQWVTIVANPYALHAGTLDALEAFNGIPLDENPTGRFAGTKWKPFIAVTGTTLDDPSSVTDARKTQVTIALAPAPGSDGYSFEATANAVLLYAVQAQNQPHLDVAGRSYPDMPTPTDIGSMADYNFRDAAVKKGCSTVDLVAGAYQVQDFVTTYHPDGEVPPQFRWVRNLNIDFNFRYAYYLDELINVVDHVIVANDAVVDVDKTVSPKQWIQCLNARIDDFVARAMFTDPDFAKDSIEVDIGGSNPDRLETFLRYKRTGFARISASTVEANFEFAN